MKIIKALILWAALLLTGIQSGYADAHDEPGILHPNGLLWKIEKQGLTPSYLFGTMHVSDPRVVQLDPQTEKAFLQAEQFVMEMVMNFKAVGFVASASFFNDGRNLQQLMGHLEYKKLTSLINKRIFIDESILKNMKPWAVLMMLMMPVEQQMQGGAALDMVLFRRASQRKMNISGLESPEEQIAVFEFLSIDEQLWMLNRAIDELEVSDAQMPVMLEAYLEGDLAVLIQMQQKFMYEDSDIDDRFMHQLLDVRNVRMADRLQPVLQKGNAFIAIGALHLPGKGGVLDLLEQQGFVVNPVN